MSDESKIIAPDGRLAGGASDLVTPDQKLEPSKVLEALKSRAVHQLPYKIDIGPIRINLDIVQLLAAVEALNDLNVSCRERNAELGGMLQEGRQIVIAMGAAAEQALTELEQDEPAVGHARQILKEMAEAGLRAQPDEEEEDDGTAGN